MINVNQCFCDANVDGLLVHSFAGLVRFRKPNVWVEVFSVTASNVAGGTDCVPRGGVVGEVLATALGMNQGYSSPATIVQTTRPEWAGSGGKD